MVRGKVGSRGRGREGTDRGRSRVDFKRMRLLPKFRFLRFQSRCLCCVESGRANEREKGRVSEAGRGRTGAASQRRTPTSWAKYKKPGQAACLRSESESESEVCQSPLGATLRFYLCFDFFSSPHFFRVVFFFFCFFSFRLVSAFVLFCALAKKHFNLQMRNKFQTKAQSFPLQINF